MKCLTCHGLITNGNCGCSTGTQGAASVNIDTMLRDRDAEIARLKAEGAMLADKAAAAIRERDHALAACAEMRAALLDWHGPPNPEHSVEHCPTCALLSCTDLGRGWASPEDTAQMVGALQMVESDGEFGSLHEVTRKFVVDVLALLKAEVETAKAWQGAAVLRNYDAVRILTEEIGAPGPENIDETARRAVMVIRAHKRALAAGPAALRAVALQARAAGETILADGALDYAANVEAAQEAAMKEGT